MVFVLSLWVGAIALFYYQWGKINGLGLHQLDYVHANLEASPAKSGHKSSITPSAQYRVSSNESGDDNSGVSSINLQLKIKSRDKLSQYYIRKCNQFDFMKPEYF